ncbi:MAG: winged helix-turn-helix domain-containing protein [Candidatus Pacebacteria bacterium]|nr:winged helix-turn-helix domain-containing protein [Candidatus Paceibacterota bacterium]
MKVSFCYQPELEYERILCLYHQLPFGIYQDNGFLVLPYRLPRHPKTVYLPDIPGFSPIRYLKELRTNPWPDIPLPKNPATEKVLKAIKETSFRPQKISQTACLKTKKNWFLIQPLFEDYFLDLFPQYRLFRITLETYWTRYGTLVSFGSRKQKGKKIILKIYLRDDMGLPQIAEGFLSGFYREIFNRRLQYSFLQREAIVDFILQETKLARLFPDYPSTLKAKYSISKLQKHCLASAAYLKKLGFETQTGLSLDQDKLLINNRSPKITFSPTEELILKKLVKNADEPISYFELGDFIWKNDPDKFSLWALSRLIYKIRHKLYQNSISPEHIKNLRGRGYYYTSQP